MKGILSLSFPHQHLRLHPSSFQHPFFGRRRKREVKKNVRKPSFTTSSLKAALSNDLSCSLLRSRLLFPELKSLACLAGRRKLRGSPLSRKEEEKGNVPPVLSLLSFNKNTKRNRGRKRKQGGKGGEIAKVSYCGLDGRLVLPRFQNTLLPPLFAFDNSVTCFSGFLLPSSPLLSALPPSSCGRIH